jgi:hypothetical protein
MSIDLVRSVTMPVRSGTNTERWGRCDRGTEIRLSGTYIG